MSRVFIIAEAGVNHNGSLELACKLVDAAVSAGADAVKFQTFKSKNLVSINTEKAAYQKNDKQDKGQLDMLKQYELSYEDFEMLMQYCIKKNIMFLSTPFDLESIDFLNRSGLEIFKIPSGEVTNLPYLRKINSYRKKVILSTGMSTLGDIEGALSALIDIKEISLLHCTTSYPTPYESVNLSAMLTLKNAFKLPVGYSDHTNGIEIACSAVALGAEIIEKHFTLDKNMEGPDHKASLEPQELSAMVTAIRNIEKAIGGGKKEIDKHERVNMAAARKSLIANAPIKAGDVFTEMNLTVKRPGNGISPMRWDEYIGRPARKDYKTDEVIDE